MYERLLLVVVLLRLKIFLFLPRADEIPILGFAKQPFISFHEVSIPEIERKEKAQDDQVSV